MDRQQRHAFLAHFAAGLVPLLIVYFFLTAFRDFRDHYAAEIFQTLGLGDSPGIFSQTEKWALFGSIVVMASLNLIADHRRALSSAYAVVVAGFLLIGAATLAYRANIISGYPWMALVGLGMNLAYVPYGAVLFERMMSASRFAGTSAFAIQFADGVGYSGSVIIQIVRDFFHAGRDRLDFFVPFSLGLSLLGAVLMTVSGILILRRIDHPTDSHPAMTDQDADTPKLLLTKDSAFKLQTRV